MATQQQTQKHWYNDKELFFHGLAHSNYVTAFTDWFMGFAGKWAELVLYATVLYSCAELYPGVTLPAGLSLAVFLVQLGALDIGGLSLSKLAKQAHEEGNTAGAAHAETLSKWLIGIMLVGVVVVGLEHALPVALPSWVITSVDVLLVVARSICAVLYGRVVHDLKHEMVRTIPEAQAHANMTEIATELSQRFTEHLGHIEANTSARIVETEQRMTERFTELMQAMTERIDRTSSEQTTAPALAELASVVQSHSQSLAELAALPGLLDRQLRQMQQEVKTALEMSATRPKLALVERTANTSESGFDKAAFVRQMFTEHPEMRNADIQRKAAELGVNISPAYISEIRKAFTSEQTQLAESERAS